MGALLSLFFALIIVFSFYIKESFNENLFKTRNEKIKSEFSLKPLDNDPVTTHKNIEEVEKTFIKACREIQAYILTCRYCYLEGNKNCPYPKDSFCRDIKDLDENSVDIAWSFLPKKNGYVYETKNFKGIKPQDARTQDDLKKIIQYKLSHTLDYSSIENDLKYNKPSGNPTDPCAVEGIINK